MPEAKDIDLFKVLDDDLTLKAFRVAMRIQRGSVLRPSCWFAVPIPGAEDPLILRTDAFSAPCEAYRLGDDRIAERRKALTEAYSRTGEYHYHVELRALESALENARKWGAKSFPETLAKLEDPWPTGPTKR